MSDEELSYEEIADAVVLPEWLEAQLPEAPEVAEINYHEDKAHYSVSYPNGKGSRGWHKLRDVLGFLREGPYDAEVITHGPDVEPTFGGFTEIGPATHGIRILLNFTARDKLRLLKYEYYVSQDLLAEYRDNPTGFWESYSVVDTHPAFWVREEGEGRTLTWQHQGHAHRLWASPLPSGDDSNVVWTLETGSHIAPDYYHHYHDPRLDVEAPTIEEAYIQLAALVVKFFHDDGTEREDVEYEKSKLELLLEERIAGLEL